jgi:hypothetical protein
MNRNHRKRHESLVNTAFMNLFAVLAKGMMVVLLSAIALIAVNQKKAEVEGIKPKAEYIIEVHWPDNSYHDVDTWLLTPAGSPIYYLHPDNGVVFLDRDDRGNNDFQNLNGDRVEAPGRSEITSIRGIVPGEYVLNVHLYAYRQHGPTDPPGVYTTHDKVGELLPEPVPVTVEIKKVNPVVKLVFTGKVTFTLGRQELHVTRFTINPNGDITDIRNDLPTTVMGKNFSKDSFVPPEGVVQ